MAREKIDMKRDKHLSVRSAGKEELIRLIDYMVKVDSIITDIYIEESDLDKEIIDYLVDKYSHNLVSLQLNHCLELSDLESIKKCPNLASFYVPEFHNHELDDINEYVDKNFEKNYGGDDDKFFDSFKVPGIEDSSDLEFENIMTSGNIDMLFDWEIDPIDTTISCLEEKHH